MIASDIFIHKTLTLFYKIKNSFGPPYLKKLLSWNASSAGSLRLRSCNILLKNHYPLTAIGGKCIRCSLPQIINNADVRMIEATGILSLDNFKRLVKKSLIDKYSTNECNLSNCYACRLKNKFFIE